MPAQTGVTPGNGVGSQTAIFGETGGATAFSGLTGNLALSQIPTGGTSSTYLRGDGVYATPPGGSASYQTPYNVKFPTYPGATLSAKGDGVTDDGPAIRAAIAAAYALVPPTGTNGQGGALIYFPAGFYRIAMSSTAASNLFAGITVKNINTNGGCSNLTLVGEGMANTIILMDTVGGGATTACSLVSPSQTFTTTFGLTFRDLGFWGGKPNTDGNWDAISSIPAHANSIFNFYSDSAGVQNSNFRFYNVLAAGAAYIFDIEGTQLCSEFSHFGCNYNSWSLACYQNNNPQSVNHRFYGCDFQNGFGHVFKLGGGDVRVYGGSVIMASDATTATNQYLVNFTTGLATSKLDTVRVELRGNFSCIINQPNAAAVQSVFDKCDFLDEATSAKTAFITTGTFNRIDFIRCDLVQGGSYAPVAHALPVIVNASGPGGDSGTILFDKCTLPQNFSDQCSINYVGSISSRETRGNYGSNQQYSNIANDFTINAAWPLGIYSSWGSGGQAGDSCSLQPQSLEAYIKNSNQSWPISPTTENTLYLPKYARLQEVRIRFTTAGNYTGLPAGSLLRVTNGCLPWAVSTPYPVGYYVVISGYVYKCTTAGTSQATTWTPSGHVTGTTYTDTSGVAWVCLGGGGTAATVLHSAATVGTISGSTPTPIIGTGGTNLWWVLRDYDYAVGVNEWDRTLRLSIGANTATASAYGTPSGSYAGGEVYAIYR